MKNNRMIVSISFGNYLKSDGGVDKAIWEYKNIYNSNQISYMHISPIIPNFFNNYFHTHNFYTIVLDGEYLGVFDENGIWNYLKNCKNRKISILGVHLHHYKKFNLHFLKSLLSDLNAPIYFFIHDFYSICDNVNLMFNNKYFCGYTKKEDNTCLKCIYGKNINEHKKNFINLLQNQKDVTIVSPSKIALDVWKLTYAGELKDVKYCIVPHLYPIDNVNHSLPKTDKLKIGFIGRYVENKGKNQWEKLVSYIEKSQLDIQLYYLGFSDVPQNFVEKVYVKVCPENPNAMVNAIKKTGINCAFLWSVWPETYSYTYFEAYSNNLFILTNSNSGNIAQMVLENGNGYVYEDIDELVLDLKNIHEKLVNFNIKNIFGPASYVSNPNIITLHGNENLNYKIKDGVKKEPVVIKKLIELMYNKKNNLK